MKSLVPVAKNKFISPANNTTYEFLQNEAGAIQWARITLASGYNYDRLKHETLAIKGCAAK